MAMTQETLFAKAKLVIERGIRDRDRNEQDTFQLWAAVSLELLAKSALGKIHPALVADPTHLTSLLFAVGHLDSTDIRTIQAKTVYERCKRVVHGFDETCERFCNALAHARNAELHSGASPFGSIPLERWQPKYWSVVEILLTAQGLKLNDFLGETEAVAAAKIILDAREALVAAVQGRVKRHSSEFLLRGNPDEQQRLRELSAAAVRLMSNESEVPQACPACQCLGRLSGELVHERELSSEPDDIDPETGEALSWTRMVEETYASDSFWCPTCRLELDGEEEVEAAQLPDSFTFETAKEYDGSDEYGNE